MKTQFSFKESSRITTEQSTRPTLNQYNSNLINKNSWTDLRIQQIKRKYDTPSSHQKHNKTNKYNLQNQQPSNHYRNSFPYSTKYKQPLKQSLNLQLKPQEDEVMVIKKIEQMKQSLLKDKKKSINLKHERDKYYIPLKQLHNNYSIDPRVKNIDKINNKIKHILDCLHQNESDYQDRNQSINQSLEINQQLSTFQQTKILERQKISYKDDQQSQVIQYNLNKQEQSQTPQIKAQKQFTYRKTEIENKWREEFKKEEQSQKITKDIKSKSCLEGYSKIFKKQTQKESTDTKKINQQIEKIQARIRKFQDQKKKLNIDFKPFAYKKHNRSFTNIVQPRYQKPILKNDHRTYRYKQQLKQSNQFSNIQIKQASNKLKNSQTHSQQSNPFESEKWRDSDLGKNQKDYLNNQLRKKTSQGIQHRKKLLSSLNCGKRKCQQIQKLVKVLANQVSLDQQFRNSKIWLQNCFLGNKYQVISKQILKYSVNLSVNQIQKEFKLTEEQNNPFYSLRENASNIQILVENYIKAKNHWKQNIIGKFNKEKLIQQNERQGKIDLQKKGYVSLSDLVRLLNMEGGKFFRNRDVILIWRRIADQDRVNLDKFYQIVG